MGRNQPPRDFPVYCPPLATKQQTAAVYTSLLSWLGVYYIRNIDSADVGFGCGYCVCGMFMISQAKSVGYSIDTVVGL